MIGAQHRLEKIAIQISRWLKFVFISPILFLISSLTLYNIFHTTVPFVFYFNWILFISASFAWWIWLIKVITDMIKIFNMVLEVIQEIKKDIHEVKVELSNIDNVEIHKHIVP